jgi:hypothetical protein
MTILSEVSPSLRAPFRCRADVVAAGGASVITERLASVDLGGCDLDCTVEVVRGNNPGTDELVNDQFRE